MMAESSASKPEMTAWSEIVSSPGASDIDFAADLYYLHWLADRFLESLATRRWR
jgi:hypothetical protein